VNHHHESRSNVLVKVTESAIIRSRRSFAYT